MLAEQARIAEGRRRLQARLRLLIESGTLPQKPPQKVFAGPSLDRHACILSGETPTHGAVEYEVGADDHVVYLHPRCFKLWRELDEQTA